MKRFSIFPYALCLVIGLLAGILLPIDLLEESTPLPPTPNNTFPTTQPAVSANPSESSSASAAEPEALDFQDNFPLLNAACAVNRALQRQDYASLSAYVHPGRGVTFTPYSPWSRTPTSPLLRTRSRIWLRTRPYTPGALWMAGATPLK